MLKKALTRIKLSTKTISIIINLFKNRSNTISTIYGSTKTYEVQDGIDQGDLLSPLLWRIFYDPLLQEIDEKCMGYKIKTTWSENLPSPTSQHIPITKSAKITA